MRAKVCVMAFALAGLIGCASNRAPDVSGKVSDSLKQAGLNDVSVTQDRDKGVVTLRGNVPQQSDKDHAEQIAKQAADGEVVANEIAVVPKNDSEAKTVSSDLDKGIEANLNAALTQAKLKGITHSTTNGVVTLKGELSTPAQRTEAEHIAAGVPNVQQVVNEIDVKNQRATSSSNSSADRSK
jgi:hyperosmotically inducible periplasmic protein